MIKELFFGFLLIHSALAKHGHPGKNKRVPDPGNPEPMNPGPGAVAVAGAGAGAGPGNPEPGPGNPEPGPGNPEPGPGGEEQAQAVRPIFPGKKWLTLTGDMPWVIAQGGYPTLFPDSSLTGYNTAVMMQMDLPLVVKYCNLQLTKDNLGVCLPDVKLNNCTDAADKFPKEVRRYNINGQDVEGVFSIDFTVDQMVQDIKLRQSVFSRTNLFDGINPVKQADSIATGEPMAPFWLNVQNEAFWVQHKLSALRFIEDSSQIFMPTFISSPDISFLKAMKGSKVYNREVTVLVFRFLGPDELEPSTKEKYSSLVGKLAMVRTFADAILVPKDYIWPVGKDGYLQPATTLVQDAHKEEMFVFASGFASDYFTSYNYSYDPEAEYLQFIDNPQFSVDGVITETPSSALTSMACIAVYKNASTKLVKGLVISHNGASIDYPGCTDLAYEKAITDGADVIDCNVQMTKDGVAFCLESPDLIGKTTAAMSLMERSTSIPEIQQANGIFSFDLTWSEIQSVKPLIASPYVKSGWQRNPKFKNAGKLVTLTEFLDLAKKNGTGVLVGIQNAAYLASKKGLDIIDKVSAALKNATLDPKQQVLIQSDDTSVLSKFKESFPTYKRVFLINKPISSAPKPALDELKKFADAVNVVKNSIIRYSKAFLTTVTTTLVNDMHAANISVYVSGFSTETQSMLLDYYSDPYTELYSYFSAGIDGVLTVNPKTATTFMRNPCSADMNSNSPLPYLFPPVAIGEYLAIATNNAKPNETSGPPVPPLEVVDITDPPLPPVNVSAAATDNNSGGGSPSPTSSQPRIAANINLSMAVTLLLISLLSIVRC